MDRATKIGSKTAKQAMHRLSRFRDEEDGSLMILSLQVFLLMLVTTGIAIDFSRQEERRELIQNTLDRAALAAASLSQEIDPKTVVLDYLQKAGLGNLEVDPVVEQGDNLEWRRVTIDAKDSMSTLFGGLVGVETLSANGYSQAEESVGNVEISLVLDVSSSMNSTVSSTTCTGSCPKTRLTYLKEAAADFVEKMFDTVQPDDAVDGRLSINIVPYNTNVYLGTDMQQAYTLSDDYTVTSSKFYEAQCADFDADEMAKIEIDGSETLTRTMYGTSWDIGDIYGESRWNNYTANPLSSSYVNCFDYSQNKVIPLGYDEDTMLTYLTNLKGAGYTSTDVGIKWGAALLDPSSQDEMAKIDTIDSSLTDRPIAYDGDTMKVMVVMSDGSNTYAYSTLPGYRQGATGMKSVYAENDLNGMQPNSTYVEGVYYYDADKAAAGDTKPYYNYKTSAWVAATSIMKTETTSTTQTATCTQYKYGGNWYWNSCSVSTSNCTRTSQTSSTRTYTCSETTYTTTETQAKTLYDINFEYLYQTKLWNPYAVADLLRRPFGRTTHEQYDEMALQSENLSSTDYEKDKRTDALCTLAKKKGVIIFTVAADAPTRGAEVLESCASGSTYAYEVTGDDLSTAFASIASSITALRLTN